MKHSISRGALYEQVWSEPISQAAKKFGVSDVALAKACRRHGIPVPHRGWWAKKRAGKTVARIALPKPKAVMPDIVTVGRDPTWREQMEERARREPPPPPLPQDILDLAADARRQVGTIVVPKTLGKVHALLVPLLERDKRRKLAMRGAGYTPYYDRPVFADRFERRRLRVLNTLFRALERLGHRPALGGLDARELYARIGEQHVKFTLDASRDRRRRSTGKQGDERPLSLQIPMSRQVASQQTVWEDARDVLLEAQIPDIVAGLVVAAEIQWRLDIAAREERERQRREEEERRERDRQDKLEQARRDALLRAAIDWRHARYIREFVAAVQAATAGETEQRPTPTTAGTEWVSWALAEADRLDTAKSYEPNSGLSNGGVVTP